MWEIRFSFDSLIYSLLCFLLLIRSMLIYYHYMNNIWFLLLFFPAFLLVSFLAIAFSAFSLSLFVSSIVSELLSSSHNEKWFDILKFWVNWSFPLFIIWYDIILWIINFTAFNCNNCDCRCLTLKDGKNLFESGQE